jgi:hypothetical protein
VVADDSQIVEIIASKRYAPTPQLSITITPLPALTAQGRAAGAPLDIISKENMPLGKGEGHVNKAEGAPWPRRH